MAATDLDIHEVLRRIGDQDAGVRREALKALERCGPEDSELAPDLTKAVLHRVLGVERFADALGQIGPGAAVAVPALLGLLQEPKASRRVAGSRALAGIGTPAAARAVPALTRLLAHEKDESVREQVIRDLGRFATHSREAAAALSQYPA